MRHNTLKLLAFTGAVALGLASYDANAQVETVNATLITSSAITSNDVSDMDFGEWFVNFVTGTPSITLTNTGAATATVTGTIGTSVLTQITAPATEGVVTVQTPSPSSLTMTRSATNNFGTAGLSLSAVTFRTASQTGNINADAATGTITVLAAATDETINFGGTIAVTADPIDGTHTADFVVTFSY